MERSILLVSLFFTFAILDTAAVDLFAPAGCLPFRLEPPFLGVLFAFGIEVKALTPAALVKFFITTAVVFSLLSSVMLLLPGISAISFVFNHLVNSFSKNFDTFAQSPCSEPGKFLPFL